LPRVDVDGKYRAFVEIENEKNESGSWRLLPGMTGRATFEVGQNVQRERKRNKNWFTSEGTAHERGLVNAN